MNDVAEHDHPDHEKNRISITVRNGGNVVSLDENVHVKVKKVLEDALKAFLEKYGFQPPPNDIPYLRYGNTDLTDLEKTLLEYGIPDKAVIDLLFQHRGG